MVNAVYIPAISRLSLQIMMTITKYLYSLCFDQELNKVIRTSSSEATGASHFAGRHAP